MKSVSRCWVSIVSQLCQEERMNSLLRSDRAVAAIMETKNTAYTTGSAADGEIDREQAPYRYSIQFV